MPYPPKTSPEAILEAALEILEAEGEAALSMRALALRLGVKAPSLYRHYADKDALEAALVRAGAAELRAAMEGRVKRLAGRKAVFAAAGAYLEFARKKPALYDLLMTRAELPRSAAEPGKELWNSVLGLMQGVTGNPDDTAAAVALWSFLHGYSVLERSGMFGPSGPKGGFERGLGALLTGLSEGG